MDITVWMELSLVGIRVEVLHRWNEIWGPIGVSWNYGLEWNWVRIKGKLILEYWLI